MKTERPLCQSHRDLTGRLSLTIAGLDLVATKDVSSHPSPVSAAGTPGPAGPESHQFSWTVLRHCLYDGYAQPQNDMMKITMIAV